MTLRPSIAILIAALALLTTPALAFKEIEVQTRYCAGMKINQHLSDGSEVDCLMPYQGSSLAVEVDFTDHWAQAIGQSLHYARVIKERPAIILVCNEGRSESVCERHLERMVDTLAYWRIGMLVWYCRSEVDVRLADCRFVDLYDEVME